MSKYLFDYHTQTLEHGTGKSLKVEETIQAAISKGLSAICLTDHYPLPEKFEDPTPHQDCAMSMGRYEKYQLKVSEAMEKYKSEIEVLRGAEFDWLPKYKKWTSEEISRWNFDYCIGSVHFIDKFSLDYTKEEFLKGVAYYGSIEILIKKYYARVCSMAATRMFDAVGHLDLVKKYNAGDLFDEAKVWYQKAVMKTLDCIQKNGMVIEINTSGLDKNCKEQYPSLWIIREAKKRNISLTLGSDAHVPENIGRNLDKAITEAKKAGYTSLIRFKKRKRIEIKI